MPQPYLECSYSKGRFLDERAVKFISSRGDFDWCLVSLDDLVQSDQRLSNGEYEGFVRIAIIEKGRAKALVAMVDAYTGEAINFSVASSEITFF